ncbi:outer membrane protein assembly factor BamE domain-containing protein [Chromobacterium violaceum]|uniref:Outer membrane protein assembly factor BamE domain-containing protein n=1 Tax=Chromobacterium violaceum TaxID=536 RepID=A0A202B5J4_CHRVL|nr:outer membrane protein assembly factor BamE [Chromobacterium violaceum]OVE46688.1 hypothetical protein CBW21_17480 [Chromobacterium violaceum]
MRKLAVTTIALSLAACAGTSFKWDSARQIKPGMTTQEVTALMGTPNNVSSISGAIRYVWTDVNLLSGTTKTLAVDFVDGKVQKAPPIPDEFK